MASSKEIPPGGEGRINVDYKTSSKIGPKTQTISVHTNDPEQGVVKLQLKMDIRAVLAMDPYRMRFGRLKKGTEYPAKYASLIGTEKDNAKIVSAESLKPELPQQVQRHDLPCRMGKFAQLQKPVLQQTKGP